MMPTPTIDNKFGLLKKKQKYNKNMNPSNSVKKITIQGSKANYFFLYRYCKN